MSDVVKQGSNINVENMIFSLDIGTRNVVGTLSYLDDDKYVIVDHESMSHPERAMFDGQIHDIEKVAKIATKVKETLERRNNIKLEKVAIAAAGRALMTTKVKVSQDTDYTREINKEVIDSIEVEAIQAAQKEISPKGGEKEVKYYCVGYNVIRYYLDDSIILNPIGHRGSHLSVEIIATFLPHIVVDSLYSVMSKVGLEVMNMTLEPIAAINVAIPQNLRLLNLALVDVGAGTSDIAITKDGTVISFGMVSIAGDEITEAIAREFLLDFNTAEKLKVSLSSCDEVTFSDVIGLPQTLKSSEVLSRIEQNIERVSTEIANKVLESNGKAPSAIFFIGGGCQIPTLTGRVAELVGIPKERVAIKGIDALSNLEFKCERLYGSEFVTPIGIGYTAAKNKENDFLTVTVNDNTVRLFNSRQLTVTDALVLAGYSARKLLAVKGQGYTITENGKTRRLYGTYGEPARIFVNGLTASLDMKIKNKDIINIEPATEGKKVYYTVAELLKDKFVRYEGKSYNLFVDVKVNSLDGDLDLQIKEDDIISYDLITTLDELSLLIGEDIDRNLLLVNGNAAGEDYLIEPGDRLMISGFRRIDVSGNNGNIKFEDEDEDILKYDHIENDHESTVMTKSGHRAGLVDFEKEKAVKIESIIEKNTFNFTVNDNPIMIITEKSHMIFVDIFDHVNFDLSSPKGIIDLVLNGNRANYSDMLKNGDVIGISWK